MAQLGLGLLQGALAGDRPAPSPRGLGPSRKKGGKAPSTALLEVPVELRGPAPSKSAIGSRAPSVSRPAK